MTISTVLSTGISRCSNIPIIFENLKNIENFENLRQSKDRKIRNISKKSNNFKNNLKFQITSKFQKKSTNLKKNIFPKFRLWPFTSGFHSIDAKVASILMGIY